MNWCSFKGAFHSEFKNTCFSCGPCYYSSSLIVLLKNSTAMYHSQKSWSSYLEKSRNSVNSFKPVLRVDLGQSDVNGITGLEREAREAFDPMLLSVTWAVL